MPDGDPRYEKMPRPESIAAFRRYLSSNRVVSDIQQIKPQLFKIERFGKSTLLVHVTNIYIVGEADVYEILSEEPDINCIVTISAWNSYTLNAKELCRQKQIGLFIFREFMGAVYYSGRRFLDYIHPDDRE